MITTLVERDNLMELCDKNSRTVRINGRDYTEYAAMLAPALVNDIATLEKENSELKRKLNLAEQKVQVLAKGYPEDIECWQCPVSRSEDGCDKEGCEYYSPYSCWELREHWAEITAKKEA